MKCLLIIGCWSLGNRVRSDRGINLVRFLIVLHYFGANKSFGGQVAF